ncbi:hypothetical protein QFC21_006108 [Naganishia friedmannii]|uniref:Uncharacterized protein n=1 Tax=Naganishia friedmannii TaxID=89922 RepID=A0ACC2V4V0_9TREE|nr:hypothetical protein QFC21_006108 [Naganishia friedmannii]
MPSTSNHDIVKSLLLDPSSNGALSKLPESLTPSAPSDIERLTALTSFLAQISDSIALQRDTLTVTIDSNASADGIAAGKKEVNQEIPLVSETFIKQLLYDKIFCEMPQKRQGEIREDARKHIQQLCEDDPERDQKLTEVTRQMVDRLGGVDGMLNLFLPTPSAQDESEPSPAHSSTPQSHGEVQEKEKKQLEKRIAHLSLKAELILGVVIGGGFALVSIITLIVFLVSLLKDDNAVDAENQGDNRTVPASIPLQDLSLGEPGQPAP